MTKQEIVTAFEKEFKNQFVADNIPDCIPVKNWEEMSGEVMSFIKDLLTEFEQAVREECIKIISTHPENEGSYCDTGEDMEWACRSKCVYLAIKRLTK